MNTLNLAASAFSDNRVKAGKARAKNDVFGIEDVNDMHSIARESKRNPGMMLLAVTTDKSFERISCKLNDCIPISHLL